MAKSLGNLYALSDLIEKGFSSLAFPYFCLTAHYRSKLNFSFKALKSTQSALNSIYQKISEWKSTQRLKKEKKLKFKRKNFSNQLTMI